MNFALRCYFTRKSWTMALAIWFSRVFMFRAGKRNGVGHIHNIFILNSLITKTRIIHIELLGKGMKMSPSPSSSSSPLKQHYHHHHHHHQPPWTTLKACKYSFRLLIHTHTTHSIRTHCYSIINGGCCLCFRNNSSAKVNNYNNILAPQFHCQPYFGVNIADVVASLFHFIVLHPHSLILTSCATFICFSKWALYDFMRSE